VHSLEDQAKAKMENHNNKKAKATKKELKLTLEEVYNGGVHKIPHSRYRCCEECEGKGGSEEVSCSTCKGKGMVEKVM